MGGIVGSSGELGGRRAGLEPGVLGLAAKAR